MLHRNGPIIQPPQTTRLNQDEIGNLNSSKTVYEIASIIKKLLWKASPDPDGFTGEFYLTLKKKKLTLTLHSLSQKIKRKQFIL